MGMIPKAIVTSTLHQKREKRAGSYLIFNHRLRSQALEAIQHDGVEDSCEGNTKDQDTHGLILDVTENESVPIKLAKDNLLNWQVQKKMSDSHTTQKIMK